LATARLGGNGEREITDANRHSDESHREYLH
jgi:hypothetical protein